MMVLKQKLALALCTFYLFSVIGLALSIHFCGGKLASISVNSGQAKCKFCKAEQASKKDDGCCKNTKVEVKVKDSHQTEDSAKLPKVFSLETLLPPHTSHFFKKVLPSFFCRVENKAPPKSTQISLHLLNCVFRN